MSSSKCKTSKGLRFLHFYIKLWNSNYCHAFSCWYGVVLFQFVCHLAKLSFSLTLYRHESLQVKTATNTVLFCPSMDYGLFVLILHVNLECIQISVLKLEGPILKHSDYQFLLAFYWMNIISCSVKWGWSPYSGNRISNVPTGVGFIYNVNIWFQDFQKWIKWTHSEIILKN